jgi:DNA processing protein
MTDLDEIRGIRAALADLAATSRHAHDLQRVIAELGPRTAYASLTTTDLLARFRHLVPDGRSRDRLQARAANAVAEAAAAGARIIVSEDPEWPARLPDLTGAAQDAYDRTALCLWVRGDLPVGTAAEQTVAVVGARAATAYGTTIAADLGHQLTEDGHTVACTGAYGIESAALRGALAAGERPPLVVTVAVDRPYPAGNTILHEVTNRGLLVSAFPPGTQPRRDRILRGYGLLAALTRGSVLVEAGLRSTSRAVPAHSLALDRPAMAVPGPVTSALSAGVHELLRANPAVRLVRNAADVETELSAPR